MLRNRSTRTLGLVLLAALAGCGNAKVIRRDQYGGVIELQGDRSKAMEQANQLMSQHCQAAGATIISEGEEAIGTDTYSREDTSSDSAVSRNGRRAASDSTTTGQQSTRTATAWRIHYGCGAAGQQPPAGGPPPMGGPSGAPPPVNSPAPAPGQY